VARKPEISDAVVLPLSVHKNPAVTCSQKSFSTYAGSVENEEEDWMIIEDGTGNQDIPVCAASRANILIFQSEKETLATGSEVVVRRKCSDDDITIIRHIMTPPRISLNPANRINCEVRRLYWKQ
jgi:hypothetical protein